MTATEVKDIRIIALRKMSISAKNSFTAIWISKERSASFNTLDLLFMMDDEWKKVYEENRKYGFSGASLKATTHVLNLIYGK